MTTFLQRHPRTRYNGEYRAAHVGEQVTVFGWVQT